MSHRLHKNWLKVAAVIIGVFGPVFFLGTMPSTMEPARLTLDVLSWPIDGATTYASPDTRFLSALTGGFLLGWGVTIRCRGSSARRRWRCRGRARVAPTSVTQSLHLIDI